MTKLLLKNAKTIVTCDKFDNVFYDADILIEGAKILSVGKSLECPDAEVIDAKDMFVYPGLVNTHHHLLKLLVVTFRRFNLPNCLTGYYILIMFGKM